MADIQSDIKVNIDTSSALASIKNLQRQISTFQSAMAKGSAANSAAAQNLQKDLLQNINATGRFAASMTTVRSTTESFTNSLEKNKFSLGEYVRFGAGATKKFGKFFKGEFETINKVTRERVKDLQTQYIQLGRDANGTMRAMKVRPLTLDLEDLGTKTQMAGQRQQLFNQLLKQGSTNLLNWGKNTQWAGRQLMVGFTIPLAVFGASASKTFMDIEKQAIRFKRVYGDAFSTPEGIEKAVKEVQELASEFTKYGVAIETTMELAADAAQMGLTGAALSAQIKEATRLAVLGEVSQQEALKTSISITNAFGIASEDLASKIDFLNAVENESVTAISDLTIAIPKAAPVVRQLGGGIEELAFFLTAMKEGGINASEGANALKSGLARLINPTKAASEFLMGYGISIKGIVEANKGDIKGVVLDFAQALDQLDPLDRARAIERLFGKFQFSRISTLFQNVIQEGNQAQRVLELSNASISELASISERELGKVAESSTFKYEKAIQDFKMSLAPVGEEFLKAVTPLIEFGTSLIKQFNNMDSGAKAFITNITLLFAGLGPILLMTIGLLANGIANIIKGAGAISQLFQRLKGGPGGVANEINYLTQEQMEALAVAASLDQVHSKLAQTFTSEKAAVDALAVAYRRAVDAQRSFGVPPTIRGVSNIAPNMYASGTVNVPGPKGAGDVVPAMLSPGEAVIPAKQAEKYRGFISSMISGNVPGFANGVMLGMPRSGKSVGKNRDAADAIYQEFLKSSYANVAPTEYGHQIAPTSGHSFPIFGLGGVYSKAGGGQVFVKPVMDETAAIAEIRGTQIARQAHGLEAPEQRIVVIRDPLDSTRQRRFLALESDLDAKFIQNEPKALFNEEQYFRQLVASLVRVDKDLAAANVFGNVVADVGPAGVFDRASGIRALKTDLPSMEDQALINLLGIKGGAKRAFAESTLSLMSKMTAEQYHQHMIAEIQRVLPSLKQTIAGFGLTDPAEAKAYDAMIKRLETGLSVDWSKFHSVHSAVKIAVPKTPKAAEPVNLANGGMVRGPGGPKADVIPANLSNGEAVIDAATVKKNPGIIAALFQKKKIQVPGYAENNSNEFYSFGPGRDIPLASRQSAAEVTKILGELRNVADLIDGMDEVLYQALVRLGKGLNPTNLKRMLNEDPSLELLRSPVVGKGRKTGSQGAVKMHAGNSVVVENIEDLRGVVTEATMNTLERNNVTSARLLDNMVFGGPAAANKGRLTGTEFASTLESAQGKDAFMRYIAEAGNIPPNHPELRNFAESFRQKLLAAGSTAIDDPAFSRLIGETLEQEIYAIGSNTSQVVRDAFAEAKKYSSISANIGGTAGRDLELLPNQAFGVGPTENRRQIESITSSQNYRKMVTPIADDNLFDNSTLEIIKSRAIEAGNEVGEIFAITAGESAIAAARANSPSRETVEASNSLVDGVTTTIIGAKDDVANATKTMLAPVSQVPGVFNVPGSRRATTNPDLAPMPSGTQTGGSRAPRRATAPQQAAGGSNQTGLMAADGMMLQVGASAGRASTEIDKLGKTAKKGGVNLLGYGGMVSNLTFGATALAGAMSTVGGDVGAFGQEIFKVSGFIFAATSIIQAYNQIKLQELAITRAAVASRAVTILERAANVAGKPLVGFSGIVAKAFTAVRAFLGPIGLATIAVGALVAGIYLVNKAREEERERIEGLGKVANLAADKIEKLAGIFGVEPTVSPIENATLVPNVRNRDVAAANEVRAAEGFSEDYKSEIAAIRAGAVADVELALEFLSLKLSGKGFAPDMIDTVINALLLEAGRSDLKLNFKAIDLAEDGAVEAATQVADRAIAAFEAAAVTGMTKSLQIVNAAQVGAPEGVPQGYGAPVVSALTLAMVDSETPEYLAQTNLTAQGLAGTIIGLSSAFATSKIEVEEFVSGMDSITDSILGIENEAARTSAFEGLLEGMRTEENSDFIDSLGDVAVTAQGMADAMQLLKATSGGIDIDPNVIDVFLAANKAGADGGVIRAATRLRRRFNQELEAQIKNTKDLIDAENLKTLQDASVQEALFKLEDQNKELESSITAYEFLIEKGYSAADAFTLASDSGYAAALAASAVDPTQWALLNEQLDEYLEKTELFKSFGASGSGGAPEKGPFEDILASLKNIAQRSVNVKGGIDEIFKLFAKNKNIKLNSGFESLFVRGNFNTQFAKFLAQAEAKTRELLVRFKNGKAILTEFGLAAQKAFQANSLATFRQELRLSLQSMRDQRVAVRALTANNIGYAEAVQIASDAENASAIATAASKKSKKELLDLLKLIKKEQKLQLILEREQEAEDKRQSKIQENKDLLEGIREQIREYNNFAKAQEQLLKSNFTLIEQQAILRDPVLIKVYLDGLDADLLKAKLKEVINPEFIQEVFEQGFNNAMEAFSANEEKLDIELRFKTKEDEGILRDAQEDIAEISFRIDDLEADLKRIEVQEELITEAYDKRIKALDEIKSINDDLVDQQDKQLTIADALSQGDISAAAKAAQDLRASQAARSIDLQREALEKSKEVELAALRAASGKSRAEIEKIIKGLQMEIFEIEESRLEPAQRRIDLATAENIKLGEAFTVLGKTKLEWDAVSSRITLAKVESDLYKTSIEQSLGLVEDLETAWKNVKTQQSQIAFTEPPEPEIPEDPKSDPKVNAKKNKNKKNNKKDVTKTSSTGSNSSATAGNRDTRTPEEIRAEDNKKAKALWEQTIKNNSAKILESIRAERAMNERRPKIEADIKRYTAEAGIIAITEDQLRRKKNARVMRDQKNAELQRNIVASRQEQTKRANLRKENEDLQKKINALKFNSGGFVSGPGTPTSDSIPAMLSNGEYVIKAASVNKFGQTFLDNINAGVLPGFKKGGKASSKKGGKASSKKGGKASSKKGGKASSSFKDMAKKGQADFDRAQYVAKSQAAMKVNRDRKGKVFSEMFKNLIFDASSPEMAALSVLPFGLGKLAKPFKKGLQPAKPQKPVKPAPNPNRFTSFIGKNLPPGMKALVDDMTMIHRSMEPKLIAKHPNDVASIQGRTQGPGTYFYRNKAESLDKGWAYGGYEYKQKHNLFSALKTAKSKGYLDFQKAIFEKQAFVQDKGWNSQVVQDLIKEGYIGMKDPATGIMTNWMVGTKGGQTLKKTNQYIGKMEGFASMFNQGLKFAKGGMVKPSYFASGGMVKLPKREPAPVQMSQGGMVKSSYFKDGGFAKGTDTVPAMLTPGEFVMSRYAVENFGADKMKAINNGTYSSDSVYNYSINVNVQTDANANDIARNVMTEIRRIDSQKIRGNRF